MVELRYHFRGPDRYVIKSECGLQGIALVGSCSKQAGLHSPNHLKLLDGIRTSRIPGISILLGLISIVIRLGWTKRLNVMLMVSWLRLKRLILLGDWSTILQSLGYGAMYCVS